MSFLLEELPYQKKAIDAVLGIFDGQQRNFFQNPFQGDLNPNILTLDIEAITANKRAIIAANSLTEGEAHLCNDPDFCIEMETGTGKTLVYLRIIYELCEAYGFTKFIIVVPSVAIYRHGEAVARCSIRHGGNTSFGSGIAYSHDDMGSRNSFNEKLNLAEGEQSLGLKPTGMSWHLQGRDRESPLSQEGAAELYWSMLIEPLQR